MSLCLFAIVHSCTSERSRPQWLRCLKTIHLRCHWRGWTRNIDQKETISLCSIMKYLETRGVGAMAAIRIGDGRPFCVLLFFWGESGSSIWSNICTKQNVLTFNHRLNTLLKNYFLNTLIYLIAFLIIRLILQYFEPVMYLRGCLSKSIAQNVKLKSRKKSKMWRKKIIAFGKNTFLKIIKLFSVWTFSFSMEVV